MVRNHLTCYIVLTDDPSAEAHKTGENGEEEMFTDNQVQVLLRANDEILLRQFLFFVGET